MNSCKKLFGAGLATVLLVGTTLVSAVAVQAHEGAMKVTGKIVAIHNGWLLELQKPNGESEFIHMTKDDRLRYGRLYPGSEVVVTHYNGKICDVALAVPEVPTIAAEHREIEWAPKNTSLPAPQPVSPPVVQPAPKPVPALW